MTQALKVRVQEDMKAAMRAKDKPRLGTIRLILAAVKQREVDERIEINDEQMLTILDKMVKQRRDSIEQYERAERQDLVDQEALEIKIISEYLPEPLSEEETVHLVEQVIAELGATSVKDMGKVMQQIKTRVEGRADMKVVGKIVKNLL